MTNGLHCPASSLVEPTGKPTDRETTKQLEGGYITRYTVEELHLDADEAPGQGQGGLEEFWNNKIVEEEGKKILEEEIEGVMRKLGYC